MQQINSKMLKAALAYTEMGWLVIPLYTIKGDSCTCRKGAECSCPGKHPRIRDWTREATINTDKIIKWFTQWPESNVGVATGAGSGIVVIDIDPRNGGRENLLDLQLEYGQLPDTIEAITGSGGQHLIFKHPGGFIHNRVGNEDGLASGIDVRADGGLIVVSPSLHVSGQKYEWEASSRPDSMKPAELPQKWIELIKGKKPNETDKKPLKVDESILSGKRNDVLFKMASSFRAKGLNGDEIFAAVWQININRCLPPLAEDEVKVIVESASKYQAGSLSSQGDLHEVEKVYKLTDVGNAERFAYMLRGQYLYIPEKSTWYKYNGKVWAEDVENEIIQAVIKCIRQAQKESLNIDDEDRRNKTLKWLLSSESQTKINAAISLMASIPFMCSRFSRFDVDTMLLNVQNGAIDLRTGELRPHKKDDYMTKMAPVEYEPVADCECWMSSLRRWTNENWDLINFLQRAVGYSLTGSTKEQVLFMLYGSGANGKTTFLETIGNILGDYMQQTPVDTLMIKDSSNNMTNDLARLKGARFVTATEVESGKRMAESLVKRMTGGELITARFLHREFFDFKPEFKLWIGTNHKPQIRGTDEAIWRRIKLIPFDVTIPESERDKNLIEKLKAELPGILGWCVEGCLKWQKEGLEAPEEVRAATENYKDEMNVITAFLDDCCCTDTKLNTKASDLYKKYIDWCKDTGEHPMNQRNFGTRLTEKGLTKRRSTGGSYIYENIKFIDIEEEYNPFEDRKVVRI